MLLTDFSIFKIVPELYFPLIRWEEVHVITNGSIAFDTFGPFVTFGLGGIVVRRRAHDLRVVGSKPALATFEVSIPGQGVNTNCASLRPGV